MGISRWQAPAVTDAPVSQLVLVELLGFTFSVAHNMTSVRDGHEAVDANSQLVQAVFDALERRVEIVGGCVKAACYGNAAYYGNDVIESDGFDTYSGSVVGRGCPSSC